MTGNNKCYYMCHADSCYSFYQYNCGVEFLLLLFYWSCRVTFIEEQPLLMNNQQDTNAVAISAL